MYETGAVELVWTREINRERGISNKQILSTNLIFPDALHLPWYILLLCIFFFIVLLCYSGLSVPDISCSLWPHLFLIILFCSCFLLMKRFFMVSCYSRNFFFFMTVLFLISTVLNASSCSSQMFFFMRCPFTMPVIFYEGFFFFFTTSDPSQGFSFFTVFLILHNNFLMNATSTSN